MKKILILLMVLAVAATVFAGGGRGEEPSVEEAPKKVVEEKVIKNPDTFVCADIGDPESLDVSRAYDNASWAIIRNVYNTLVVFDGESTTEFVPMLAEEIPTVENGGISADGKTYRFKIRKGVRFHSGNTLTPEDVEYTFERNMVTDPDNGPNWFWYAYLLGGSGSRDGEGNIVVDYADIDKAIEVDGDYVVFNLPNPFPPFLSALAGAWASIVDKQFVIDNGGWPGTVANWKDYNGPDTGKDTLAEIASGTGPFKFVRWEKEVEVVLERDEDYWGPKPVMKRGIIKTVPEWSTRKLMLLQEDADWVHVPEENYAEMDKEDGLVVSRELPTLSLDAVFFNFDIETQDNPLVGSGRLDGESIPGDFFMDKDVRLAFAHAWDSKTFIDEVLLGYGFDPVTPVPRGLPFKNESLQARSFDLGKAEEHFKKAWGGQVWEKGFKVEVLYNEGNTSRETTCRILAENISSLNPKFELEIRAVPWPEYLDKIRKSTMPMFVIGWLPDYPDPDNYVIPWMHSEKGTFAAWQNYKNEEADRLIDAAAIELDPEKRKEMYYRIQEIFLEDVPSVMTKQEVENRYYKDWVEGFFYNPTQSDVFDLLPFIRKEY
jgi:peptide/nickel transport system substrate-binding protein